MQFQIGNRVQWSSQAHGSHKTKEGVVVAVVPAGQLPDRTRFYKLHRGSGVGMPRDHESYVVEVGRKPYWPRANKLGSL